MSTVTLFYVDSFFDNFCFVKWVFVHINYRLKKESNMCLILNKYIVVIPFKFVQLMEE